MLLEPLRLTPVAHGLPLAFRGQVGKTGIDLPALIEAGAIRPIIDRVFPFEETNEALAYSETGRAKGKIVIKIR